MKVKTKKHNAYKSKLIKKQFFYCNVRRAEVLQFEKLDNYLSEQDMVNLFMGFIRLIKKSIASEIESEYKKKLLYYQTKIKNILNKLN